MKIQNEEDEVTSSIKVKDRPDQNNLQLIALCFKNLLEKADFSEDDVKSIVKQSMLDNLENLD